MSHELAHERVQESETPERWLYMLHGIYGAGRNWASIARRLTRARPEWGVVLVDLRQHGASQGFPEPHTIEAAAADVVALANGSGPPIDAIMGHSFGGKVALAVAEARPESLRQVWVIDSTPDARPAAGSAWEMLQVLRSLPDVFPDRTALIEALERAGVATPIAQWMATNLESAEDGYRWRFDLDALETLLGDFFRVDLWHVVESPPAGVEVHLVKAEESSLLSGDSLERAERAAAQGPVAVHRVAGGHWVNADNPDALLELLAAELPG